MWTDNLVVGDSAAGVDADGVSNLIITQVGDDTQIDLYIGEDTDIDASLTLLDVTAADINEYDFWELRAGEEEPLPENVLSAFELSDPANWTPNFAVEGPGWVMDLVVDALLPCGGLDGFIADGQITELRVTDAEYYRHVNDLKALGELTTPIPVKRSRTRVRRLSMDHGYPLRDRQCV